MKMIKIVLISAISLITLVSTAQVAQMSIKAPGTANRDAAYNCLPNSAFSQLPSPLVAGWYSQNNWDYSAVADDYIVSGPFQSMRFWGANINDCPPGATQTFEIKFYDRNLADPTLPGALLGSYVIAGTVQPISLAWGNDYQVDLNFPAPITYLDGWVAVTRIYPGDDCVFVWLGNYTGNSASYYAVDGYWYASGGQLAFCLGGDQIPATPVSNWALIIGGILMVTFIVYRFSRV
jgi:hypothetical protein